MARFKLYDFATPELLETFIDHLDTITISEPFTFVAFDWGVLVDVHWMDLNDIFYNNWGI